METYLVTIREVTPDGAGGPFEPFEIWAEGDAEAERILSAMRETAERLNPYGNRYEARIKRADDH